MSDHSSKSKLLNHNSVLGLPPIPRRPLYRSLTVPVVGVSLLSGCLKPDQNLDQGVMSAGVIAGDQMADISAGEDQVLAGELSGGLPPMPPPMPSPMPEPREDAFLDAESPVLPAREDMLMVDAEPPQPPPRPDMEMDDEGVAPMPPPMPPPRPDMDFEELPPMPPPRPDMDFEELPPMPPPPEENEE